MNSNFANWIEYDYNPFMMFNGNGEVITLNQSAQYLISKVDTKTIYELACSYAKIDYGYKTTFIELKYSLFNFFAITVGYEDENSIGIKLYQTPYASTKRSITFKDYEISNIYLLIDISLLSVKSNTIAKFKQEIDPTLPDFKLSQNRFIKILTKVYESYFESTSITTKLSLRVGEFLQVNGKKYHIIELKIIGDKITKRDENLIENFCNEVSILVSFTKNTTILNIPMIIEK
jgi:hypothetical protein